MHKNQIRTGIVGPVMRVALDFIRLNPGCNTAEIHRASGKRFRQPFYTAVKRLIKGGWVHTGHPNSGMGVGLYFQATPENVEGQRVVFQLHNGEWLYTIAGVVYIHPGTLEDAKEHASTIVKELSNGN